MKYLLDTHIYLWWLNNDKKLTTPVQKILSNPDNILYVSVISFWEISIKFHARKLLLKTPFLALIQNLQFNLLSVNLDHMLELHKLPVYHKDPFDRMLIAQAQAENCILITDDSKIKKYKIEVFS